MANPPMAAVRFARRQRMSGSSSNASARVEGATERWASRVLFPTRDLAKGVAMALSEKALQIVALQR